MADEDGKKVIPQRQPTERPKPAPAQPDRQRSDYSEPKPLTEIKNSKPPLPSEPVPPRKPKDD